MIHRYAYHIQAIYSDGLIKRKEFVAHLASEAIEKATHSLFFVAPEMNPHIRYITTIQILERKEL